MFRREFWKYIHRRGSTQAGLRTARAAHHVQCLPTPRPRPGLRATRAPMDAFSRIAVAGGPESVCRRRGLRVSTIQCCVCLHHLRALRAGSALILSLAGCVVTVVTVECPSRDFHGQQLPEERAGPWPCHRMEPWSHGSSSGSSRASVGGARSVDCAICRGVSGEALLGRG